MGLIGLIPAAGKGTRLHPLPFSKELYPIGYHEVIVDGERKLRPKVVSQYLVNHMTRMGVEKIIITLGPGKSDIMDYYGSGRTTGVPIVYNFQSVARGMPYALDLSFPWLKKEDTVVFGMSDTIIEPENAFVDLKKGFEQKKPDLLLGLFATNNPKKFGMVDFDINTAVVKTTIDKPQNSKLTHMWGCCLWNYRFAEFMHEYLQSYQPKEGKEVVFGDVINLAIEKKLNVCAQAVSEGRYIDIGTIEDLDQALKQFHL
ncbi:dTDP-glucose pyrophosphorylase [bacterium]|nr:dTDP-glucose pyrophosphorylase [bacterium]